MKLLPIYKTELYIEIEQISNIFLYKDKTLFESVKSRVIGQKVLLF